MENYQKVKKRIKNFGPGIITGGADNDPAGIVTYTMIGATTGLHQLWLMVLSTPMMIAVQDSVARIAIVTEKSLSEVLKTFYTKKTATIVISLLLIANLFTIAADMEAVAQIFEIVTGIHAIYWLIPINLLIGYLVIFKTYRTIKKILVFLTAILSVYIFSAIKCKPDIGTLIINTFIPHIKLSATFFMAALGLLGTTISPYMMFWQATEEKIEHKTVIQIEDATFDTVAGMVYSNLVAYFIIVAAAYTLFKYRIPVSTIKEAAIAIKPVAGNFSFALFSIGITAAGFLAIPVLAGSSAYAIADLFRWREGFEEKISSAKGFYIVFLGSLLLGDIINLSPMSAVDALYYSQILDGILLPFLVAVIAIVANNKKIMGNFTNTFFNNIFCLITFIVALVCTFIMLWQLIV
ncbi:NRAMP family divalent metal transporter [Desulfurobacterium sp.]